MPRRTPSRWAPSRRQDAGARPSLGRRGNDPRRDVWTRRRRARPCRSRRRRWLRTRSARILERAPGAARARGRSGGRRRASTRSTSVVVPVDSSSGTMTMSVRALARLGDDVGDVRAVHVDVGLEHLDARGGGIAQTSSRARMTTRPSSNRVPCAQAMSTAVMSPPRRWRRDGIRACTPCGSGRSPPSASRVRATATSTACPLASALDSAATRSARRDAAPGFAGEPPAGSRPPCGAER